MLKGSRGLNTFAIHRPSAPVSGWRQRFKNIFLTLFIPIHLPNFYLVEHFSEIVLWIYPGGHCVAEEYKVLFQRREVRQRFVFWSHREPNDRGWSSPAPHLQDLHWSWCKFLWMPSLSPHCLLYFAERCTWRHGRPNSTLNMSRASSSDKLRNL